MAMARVRVVVNLHVKEGMADAYIRAWDPHYDEVNAEPGCIQYELFRSTRNPENLVLLELWESKEAFDAHYALERTRPRLGVEFRGEPGTRKYGLGGVEIYWQHQCYRFDGQMWIPVEPSR
jgi:quinol monooxygenase YgiN